MNPSLNIAVVSHRLSQPERPPRKTINRPPVLITEEIEEPEEIDLPFLTRAVICSLIFHVMLLLILSAFIIPLPTIHWNDEVLSSIVAHPQADQEPLIETFVAELKQDDGDTATDELVELQDPARMSASASTSEVLPELAKIEVNLETQSLTGPGENVLGNGVNEMISNSGGGITFFGTQAQGNSFVFVVDCSGSMRGYRFKRAVAELKKAIGQLKSFQQFYVVLYNHQAIPLFTGIRKGQVSKVEPKLLTANRVNKSRTRRWLHARREGGGTVPGPALEIALNLKPDVVFFMTDGEIPPQTRAITSYANRSEAVVHTIGFQNRLSEGLLRQIAHDNLGRYKFVK